MSDKAPKWYVKKFDLWTNWISIFLLFLTQCRPIEYFIIMIITVIKC